MDTYSFTIISTDKESSINLIEKLIKYQDIKNITNINLIDLNNNPDLEIQFNENIHKYDTENFLYFKGNKDKILLYNKALNKSQGKYNFILNDNEIENISPKALSSLFDNRGVLLTGLIKTDKKFPFIENNYYNQFSEDINYWPSLYIRNTVIKHIGHLNYKDFINKNSLLSLQGYFIRYVIGRGTLYNLQDFRYSVLELMGENNNIELKPIVMKIISMISLNMLPWILVWDNDEMLELIKFKKELPNGLFNKPKMEEIIKNELKSEQGYFKELVNALFYGQIFIDYVQTMKNNK